MLWGIEVVRSFYSHSSVEIFRSYVKLGVNFFAPILSEEVENRHQRDLSWILTKNLSRPGSSPVRPGPSPARPDLQIPYRSGNILPLLFPHQRWKIRREIFVVITIIFSTPVKKCEVMKYFHKTQEIFLQKKRNISPPKIHFGSVKTGSQGFLKLFFC